MLFVRVATTSELRDVRERHRNRRFLRRIERISVIVVKRYLRRRRQRRAGRRTTTSHADTAVPAVQRIRPSDGRIQNLILMVLLLLLLIIIRMIMLVFVLIIERRFSGLVRNKRLRRRAYVVYVIVRIVRGRS